MSFPHVLQREDTDCGAACLSMISRFYGLKLPISTIRDLIKVDYTGSSFSGIMKGANSVGFTTEALKGTNAESTNQSRIFDALRNASPFFDSLFSNIHRVCICVILLFVLNELSSDLTVIIIAHRLNTIRNCDYIYVVDNGCVTEKGTHEELLSLQGQYFRYFRTN